MKTISRRTVPPELESKLPEHLHPVLRRVLAARQVAAGELDCSLSGMLPVGGLEGAQEAASLLADMRDKQQGIVILGDFDADGATATTLMVSCLRDMGFDRVSYLVPDRFKFGYGLSPEIAELAADLKPAMIVTVDNGVSSVEGVRRAKELGIDVIVTDHHLQGSELPDAAVIVNPNLSGNHFSSKCLSGVGVAFYVMAALGRLLVQRGEITKQVARSVVADTLDLVALGTVADMVRLDYNNRILIAEGLRRICGGQTRPGIKALFAVAGRDQTRANSTDLGFGIAPRLNAAGRLEDMSLGIDCLLADDPAQARQLAERLDALNTERRALQEKMKQEAEAELQQAEEFVGKAAANDAYCLFNEGWHEGIVGLVATGVREKLGRPVIAFARADQPGKLKGSARSIPGIHIRDIIAASLESLPGAASRFGGHAMAAGMTLAEKDLPAFQRAFETEVGRCTEALNAPDTIETDGGLGEDEICLELAETLRTAGPWGQGFSEPVFDNKLRIVDQRLLKGKHLKMKLQHPGAAMMFDAIAFGYPELVPNPSSHSSGVTAHFVYRLDVNDFRGRRSVQLVVEHIHCE